MEMLLHGNALLALAAAVLWGGGDFSGGMGAKFAGGMMGSALRVIVLSHAASFSVLLLVAGVRGDAFPHGAALVWGVGAGDPTLDNQQPHDAMIGHVVFVPDHFTNDCRVKLWVNVGHGQAAIISKIWHCHGGTSR